MATKPKTPAQDALAINVSAAVQAATMYKETVAALTNRRVGLLDEKRELEDRNASLWHLPLRREEVRSYALRGVDMVAAEYPACVAWHKMFEALTKPQGQREMPPSGGRRTIAQHNGPINLADVDRVDNTTSISGGSAANGLRGVLGIEDLGLLGKGNSADIEKALCFFLGDKVKELIESRIRNFEYGAHNDDLPTMESRRAEIEANEARIAAIDADLVAVDAQLAELAPHSSGMRA